MRGEGGFTLVEIMVSVTILSVVLLGMVASTGRLQRDVRDNELETVALTLADERLARIEIDPLYDGLEDRWTGTDRPVAGDRRFVRTTDARVVAEPDGRHHKVFTVVVRGPGIQPVSRTTVVAKP